MWTYNGIVFEDRESWVSFVYLITNLVNDRKYIGKKGFTFSKTKQVKGKKKRFKVESDWKDYYGSSEELKAEVEKFGEKAFRREIIRLCKSKGEASYFEAKEQFVRNVLESDEYYNSWISCRIRKSHLTFLKV
jgi:hypothetical protein